MKIPYVFLLSCLSALAFISCSSSSTDEPQVAPLLISLNKSEITLEVGKSERLTASFDPSDAPNTAHEWRSSNAEVATVDNTGMVTAVAPGLANITAVALANNATTTCAVTVVDRIIPPTSVQLDKSEEYVLVGATVKLEATVLPANSNAKTLTWSSTDPGVATVDNDGMVHGLSAGTAEISATTTNNKVAKCRITVGERTVEFSNIRIEVIDDTSAKVSFDVTSRGVTISELGLCYDSEVTPTTESTVINLDAQSTSINTTIKNLSPNTRYFIRAFAKGNSSTYYSATKEFTTQGTIITDFKAKYISFNQIELTTPKITGVNLKVCYGRAPHPEITDNIATVTVDGENYLVLLKGLDTSTEYYFRAYSMTNGKNQLL